LARHGPVLASYSLNQHQAPNENTITAVGAEGTLRLEFHRGRLLVQSRPDADWQERAACRLDRDELFVEQANGFLDAIDGRRPVACTIEEAALTLKAVLAALDSAEARVWRTIH
jgi:hypothetical protein